MTAFFKGSVFAYRLALLLALVGLPTHPGYCLSGDVTITVTPADSPADGNVVAMIDIPVSRAHVWQVLVDCARAPAVMPNLAGCAVLQTGPGNTWDVREHRVHWISLLPDIRSQFRSDYVRETSIRFKRTGGDMTALEGSWQLEPLNGGKSTRLKYNARVGFGAAIPSFIIRNALTADVPEFLKAIGAEAVRLAEL